MPGCFVWDEHVGAWRTAAANHARVREEAAAYRLGVDDRAPAFFPPPALRPALPALRPDQQAALEAWERAGGRGVIVKPTGTGKTEIALAALARHRAPALVVAPLRADGRDRLLADLVGPVVYEEDLAEAQGRTVADYAICLAPGSLDRHHAYRGGLLQHTVEVMELACLAACGHPRLAADLDLLLVAGFFHDVGKVDTYTPSYPFGLTAHGRALGHEVLGLRRLFRALDAVPAEPGSAVGRLVALLLGGARAPAVHDLRAADLSAVLSALDRMSAASNPGRSPVLVQPGPVRDECRATAARKGASGAQARAALARAPRSLPAAVRRAAPRAFCYRRGCPRTPPGLSGRAPTHRRARMRIAFYGRYSSDNQRDTSIEDQRRIVERWAGTRGHEIVATYADVAVSGASLQRLIGLRRALEEALATPPPFEALVVDQLSRLSRDVGDTDAIVKRLRFRGIRIVAVNDGIDTADESTKISVTVKSLVNELFLDDLRKTTKRGLDGCFLKGYSTGGRTYGYRSEPVFDPGGRVDPRGAPVPVGYRLVVDPQEAAVVRELFALFRAGHGEKAIAKLFNAKYPGRRWRPNTLLLMLQNPKYVGRFVFNRREWLKHPDTGRRVWRLRPREHWDVREFEHLRIVDEATWEAVQQRLRTRRRLFEHGRSATAHLLSGLMICDECGGRLGIVARHYYGCRTRMELGACPNDLRIHRTAIEQLVIGELARHLPGYIDALAAAAARASAEPAATGPAGDHQPGRLATLRRQAESVMSAIRQGRLNGRALEEALATYQAIWEEVEALV